MKRILFVDDESKILDGLRRMLYAERSRWEMHFVLGGEAALQACESGAFDVVLSDLRMPGMDGATLLGHIRDRFPNTARIVLSGYSEAALAARTVPVAHRFLTKPCSASELQTVIEQVCSLQDILNAPEIRKIVGSVGELPSLSSTYTSLMQAVNAPDTSISRVAEIIQKDVAMSAKVLQLANSAFFGLAKEVTSLSIAATYLGMATIKNLALVSETFRVFVPGPRIPQSICEAMQQHSQQVASIAGMLPIDPGIRDVTVLAAFLHDIGSLFLASAMPDTFCAVLARAKERKCKLFEAEEELLGTSHAEIGAYLLGLWGIPHLAVEAIAHHHHPTRIPHTGFDCTTAVYLADLLAHRWDAHTPNSTEPVLEESDRASLEILGVLPLFTEFRELTQQTRG
jgi:HD-like signal output (HDOD) protein